LNLQGISVSSAARLAGELVPGIPAGVSGNTPFMLQGSIIVIDKKELRRLHSMFNSCSPLFIALGDEVRQKLVLDIVDAGAEGINVKNLSAKSRLSRPAISHHLKVLKDSGLIEPEKVGTQIFYRIDMGLSYLANVVELVSSIQRLLRDSVVAKTAAAGGNQNLA